MESQEDQLREKIKSKMDVAKTLGTFITALLAASLATLGDKARMEYIMRETECSFCLFDSVIYDRRINIILLFTSVASLFVSAALYFATMYAYDKLLMPSRFWPKATDGNIKDTTVQMHREMIKVWKYLFNAATTFLVIALALLAIVLLKLGVTEGILLFVLVAAAVLWGWLNSPDIEVED